MTEKSSRGVDPNADFDIEDPEPRDNGHAYRGTVDAGAEWKDLLGALDRDVVAWVPEPGDEVIGTVAGLVEAESEYGPYPLIELDTPDGKLVQVHCFHTVLKSEVERRRPIEGDRMAIRYLGREGKQDMARYRVVLVRATPTVRPSGAEL